MELGLVVCLRKRTEAAARQAGPTNTAQKPMIAIVFGSDQGLVGQFNDVLADYVAKALGVLPGEKKVWAVGERITRGWPMPASRRWGFSPFRLP